ncbi:MAG: transcriptional regulator [Pseudomonadota bacterium]
MRTAAEKKEFSERLKQALGRSRKRIQTPTELANAFNLRFHGESVTPQSAHKWLAGITVPTPDKIETLAEMLKVPNQWLRFGIADAPKSPAKATAKSHGKSVVPTADELQLIARLREMPPHRRKLLLDLVTDLSLEFEAWSG